MELEVREEQRQGRRFTRVPFDAPVRLTRHATGQVLELQAVNLSECGVFIETVIPFPVGEMFRLDFPTRPSGFESVSVAKVTWRRPFTLQRAAGCPPGLGLQFLLMRPGDRQCLAETVEEGGVPPAPATRTVPSRSPVAPRVLPSAPPPPQMQWRLAGGDTESIDIGPFGWLLAMALALAAVATLLLGLQPLSS